MPRVQFRRGWMVVLVIGLLALSGRAAEAEVTAFFDLAYTDLGPIVSGTWRTATGVVYTGLSGGILMTNYKLKVGGTVVYNRDFNPPYAEYWFDHAITWDTTHFADGAQVIVRVEATDTNGDVSHDEFTVTVYNKAYVLGNRFTNQGVTAADWITVRANGMNHNNPLKSTIDRKNTILNNLPPYTAFHIWTHGNAGVFGDCQYVPGNGNDFLVFANEATAAVANKTPNEPPYNFVNINGCLTGSDDTLADAFGTGNFSGPDRAFLGWGTAFLDSAHNLNWVNRVWQNLQNGETLQEAVDLSSAVSSPDANNVGDGAATPVIMGDACMKLHSVYGGQPGQWYR